MVQQVTVTGLSTTITGLNSGVIYYYTITASNNGTLGTTSAVQSHQTASGANHQYVMIGGQLFLLNGEIAEY